MLAVRLRSFLARHPGVHRALVLALALTAGGLVAAETAGLRAERRAWGATSRVWVTDAGVDGGTPVAARAVDAPRALVPEGAVSSDPSGRPARRSLGSGEIVTGADLTDGDPLARGPGTPGERRGVAVAADDTTLPVAVGDRVDVVAEGRTLATGGEVLSASPTAVVVAVAADRAAEVAAAALERRVALVLAPGG